MNLNSEHPRAQTKWHGVGLNLRTSMKPERVNELSQTLMAKHQEQSKRLDLAMDNHQMALKDPSHAANLFTSPHEREAEIAKIQKKMGLYHEMNMGLHHRPVIGSQEEFDAGKIE